MADQSDGEFTAAFTEGGMDALGHDRSDGGEDPKDGTEAVPDALMHKRRMSLDLALNLSPPPPFEPQRHDESEFDEDLRFASHAQGRFDDVLARIVEQNAGALHATIICMEDGSIIASTLDVSDAARYAECVPALVNRGRAVASLGVGTESDASPGGTIDALELLTISSRRRELLICGDPVSGTAVVVEQDRHAPVVSDAERIYKQATEDYRKLLLSSASDNAGQFTSDAFAFDVVTPRGGP